MLRSVTLALFTSLFFILSLPKPNLWFCAWLAFVPLLISIEKKQFKGAFLAGWVAGTVAFMGVLYWIVPTFLAAGLSYFIGGISCLALSLYLGLYWGVFFGLATLIFRRFGETGSIFLCAALWVGLEYLRTYLFTGFPWALLGYSLWKVPFLIQISEWTGVYGVSFLIILFNLNLFFLLKKKFKLIPWTVFFILVGTNLVLLPRNGAKKENIKTITILQGNIDQYKKWSDEFVHEILDTYGSLVQGESVKNSDLVLWPESALPGWFPDEFFIENWIRTVVKKSNRYHLVGAVTDYNHATNSAFLFSPEGSVLDRYDKNHLVPFGEFVPLPFLFGKITPLNMLGNFSKGKEGKILEIPNLKMGVTICYEAIFPNLVRKQVNEGANLLINMTNDGWYLDTAAPLQHFGMNVFRAVENRRFLVRSANTGISGVILPSGEIGVRSALNQKSAFQVQVTPLQKKTFYSQYGDLFAMACSSLSITAIFMLLLRKKHENS